MKIGIITIHYGLNFGSALQAYALSRFLSKKAEYKVEVINYIPERYSVRRRYFTTSRNYSLIKKIVYLILTFPYKFFYQCIFDKFLNRFLPLGPKISTLSQAHSIYGNYDVLITGSDQVWNNDYNEFIDKMYYLSFGAKTSKKISYAASCGKEEYTDSEWAEISQYLANFKAIGLRELQSVKRFEEHKINSELTLDPIFLLNKNEWKTIEQKSRVVFKNYILIYCLDNEEDSLIKIAKSISKQMNLPIVMIAFCHYWNRYEVDYVYRYQNPANFLWLIDNASFVVTNSFHGVAFSINFEKQFLVCKRKKYNIRLDSILEILDLKNRYVDESDFSNDAIAINKINYNHINTLKEKYINSSVEFLSKAIGE